MAYSETKITKKKKLDKDQLMLKISENETSNRIFIEFSSTNRRLVVQKSFQNTYFGRIEADSFQDSIQTLNDLKSYFNIKKENEVINS